MGSEAEEKEGVDVVQPHLTDRVTPTLHSSTFKITCYLAF